ncbi:hypothetical protein ATANTOWER_012143 [Ataeniobius toweri]|uniref:Uncharacterized protein n=1 Tax=Ataeniobius toweri TaxID=208326 RepID=A0ABU7BTY3_9TELE|nr:hypothetical protein [Ataeniobius toweri]
MIDQHKVLHNCEMEGRRCFSFYLYIFLHLLIKKKTTHLFIVFRLFETRSWGQQVREATPYNPLPGDILQLILRDPKAFPGQMGYIVPPVGFGSSPGSPHSGKCLENL